MYAAGFGIKPWRAARAGGAHRLRRAALVLVAVLALAVGLAAAAHGDTRPATTVVVQPGDTLWAIASEHYPGDDVQARVQDIEAANGLRGPQIQVGQSLKLPG